MTINVIDRTPYAELVSVVFDGECNHAGATEEMLEYGKPSFYADAGIYVNDDSEDLPTLVCTCGHEEVLERGEPDYESEDY